MPIAWKELWRKLAGHFSRPHPATAQAAPSAADVCAQDSSAADNIARSTPAPAPELSLPLHNS
eukprot:2918072-Pleurochrysis_carterae.AAC.1